MEINAAKMELRTRMRAAFESTARATASGIICEKLRVLPQWQRAKTVMGYAPMGDEPDIEPLLCVTRATALPRWTTGGYTPAQITNLQTDLCQGQFGVREPIPECPSMSWAEIDVILVPGLAFDGAGNRLGRGGGYYDRLLDCVRAAGPVTAVGVCFEWQLQEDVPVTSHDQQLDLVVSPAKTKTRDAGHDQ